MDNLIFSLNATVPVFLVIVVGYFLKRIGLLNEGFVKAGNKLNFTVTLPALLIQDMMNTDFTKQFDLKYVLFCAIVTSICFFSSWGIAKIVLRDKSSVGEFAQGCYRSSAGILGAAFAMNVYGNIGMVPLMIIGAVPLYNIYATILLTVECPEKEAEQNKTMITTVKGILTNPILIGITIGLILSAFRVKFPRMIENTMGNFAKMSTPIALLSIGGSFEFRKALKRVKMAVVATIIKTMGWSIMFIPVAVWLGYRDSKLVTLVIMMASPATPSCYVMAKSMNHEGTLSASIIVLTTMFSAFTITTILLILKTLGYV